MRPRKDGAEGSRRTKTIHDPIITLDDESTLTFCAEETECGDSYGVDIVRTKSTSPKHRI